MLLKDAAYDAERVIVMGGSHGGYLAAYLSAKYPETFIGAILRNPVIDLPSTKPPFILLVNFLFCRYDGYF